MPLVPGTRLGPYDIVALLGAGGMGEVYRAQDTRLDRTVAIKVIRQDKGAGSEDLRRRFEREERVVSSMSHPHICPLYDVGSQSGIDFLVMEFLVGETLAARLRRGPLPPDQVMRYATEIADALATAHRIGIVHRDLKPANIMLTQSGSKLLDFGLAKFRKPVEHSLTGASILETETGPGPGEADSELTDQGMLLGTFPYMSPEQLEGKEADARSDIFAFGAVVHEMATGQRAFQGSSSASLMGAILHSEPPSISTLRAGATPALDDVVNTCLCKDPSDRWQSAHDLKLQLKSIAGSRGASIPSAPRRSRTAWLGWLVAGILALAGAFLIPWRRGPPTHAARFLVTPPERTALLGSIAVSPNGAQVAFVAATPEGNASLWVRPVHSLDARAISGTEGAVHPFWSPDGRFIAFFAERKLKRIRVEGGPPQILCDAFDARGGAWNSEGVIVFSPNSGDPLWRISDNGGAPSPVTALDQSRQESSHQWPHFLPGGRRFLYLALSAREESRGIYAGSLDGKESARLTGAEWGAAYGAGPDNEGMLLFLRGRTLLGQPFDSKTLRLSGEPLPIADNLWYDATKPGLTAFSVSANGMLAYRTGGVRTTQLGWFDRAGRSLSQVGPAGAYRDPALSPDEKKIAVARVDPATGMHDIWLFEPAREVLSRLTFQPGDEISPVWSPDASQIVFASDRDGPANLYRKAASGAETEQLLLKTPVSKFPTDWSRRQPFVVFAMWDPKTQWDLWTLPISGDNKPAPYFRAEFDSFQAQFSPDGRWIAYASNETNRYEVYVQPFPLSPGRWQISTNGGAQPQWRNDGTELYYLSPDRKLMAVVLKAGATFDPGPPTPLFQTQVTGLVDVRNHYMPGAGGQRFLVNSIVGEGASTPIAVSLNWLAGLKQ